MNLNRLLQTARTNDLYDLIADGLNELATRGNAADAVNAHIEARFAEIRFIREEDRYGVVYFTRESAELASEERGIEGGAR